MKNDRERDRAWKEWVVTEARRQEQDAKEWNPRGPSSMRNGLGALNIYLGLIGITFVLFFCIGFTIVVIWKIMIPEGRITWGPSLMAVVGVGIASVCAWGILRAVKDIRGGQTSLVGFVDERKIINHHSYQGGTSRTRRISVEGVSFNISKRIYNWVSQGDEIFVTYWLRTRTVSKVSKTGKHEKFPYEHLTREEAVDSFKKRTEQDTEERMKQGH